VARLRDTVERLAAGSTGRTEADVQSDVRTFLLAAPLELANAQVIDVALETQVGGGRRIDVEAGCAAIEIKKSLASRSVFEHAVDQLAGYVRQRTEERGQRYVGVLTDGQTWVLFHLDPQGALAEVSRFKLRGGDASQLAAWLEPVLATTDRIKPTPKNIVRRLGADSAGAQLDLADLRGLYAACRHDPEVQLKRQLWARLLLSALGTNFADSDELFVTHTYLVLAAELIAHEVMHIPVEAPNGDFRALLEGHRFAIAGLHGVVEADFFDWPATIIQGAPILAGIARRLSTFDWSDVDHDVLKALYESIIDADTRRRLGEYYTPDWLAQKLVDEQFQDPLNERLLDPACGSGTFLFWAVRRALSAYDKAGVPNRVALERVVDQVQGMDLHPVAVTLARVTYLLALTPQRLADRDELTVPVFLGDSVRWEHDDVRMTTSGMTVRTSDDLELIEDELHFPEAVVDEPARFDRLIADLADRAAKRRRGTKPPSIRGLLDRHKVVGEDDREAVATVFSKLCRLHDGHRNHVWSYYIRNRARPLVFTRPDRRFHVLVGNPPWLTYRSMPAQLKQRYRTLASQRGLWEGGKVATHQDLSDLFVVRAIELYLKSGGRFAFVMPYAVLSRRQFTGFRTGDWTGDEFGTRAQLHQPEEFARIKPPPFHGPACIISGTKASIARALPSQATIWTGRVPSRHLDWAAAAEHLEAVVGEIETAVDANESPYRSRFRQGASLVPRMLVTVERSPSGPLGVAAGRVAIRSARSANEKKPWKNLPALEGVVERQFVKPMHLGATIVAFRSRQPQLALVPWAYAHLMDGSDDHLDRFPGLAHWWREAERLWDANKADASRLTLRQQIDFQNKLTRQFPIAAQRVVYTKSGQHLAACRIDDPQAVIDHKLYWTPVDTLEEARYLCAVLNSQALADAVVSLQARGQHNPRDFDMHIFALPFPAFEANHQLHARLVQLAARAELVAGSVELDDRWQFQKARRVTREALHEDGVAREIDAAVSDLIADATAGSGVPDLMADLSKAVEEAVARSQRIAARIDKRIDPVNSRQPAQTNKPRL
jgi:N-6 DNA Methylase